MRRLRHLLVTLTSACLTFIFFATTAIAHEPSKSYLSLNLESNQLAAKWDIPLRDLQTVVPLALDTNGLASWEILRARYPAIINYALGRLKIIVNGRSSTFGLTNTGPLVEDFADGSYLELFFTVNDAPGKSALIPSDSLEITYQLFFETNSLHRGLLRLEANGIIQSAVFSPDRRTQKFDLATPGEWRQFLVFVHEGVWHIWTGYDHILFLLALLLPSVLRREGGEWRGVGALRPAFLKVLKIVTAFTVAHSLTLSLATLGLVRLPSRLTESAIAASVALAATNNLWPVIRERGWIVAFGFGLIHGFGFATALSDLGLVHGALLLTLVGFNLGVEVGQLAIVAVFLPVAFGLRKTWFYQKPLLRGGSAAIILIAAAWFAERISGSAFLPF